MKQEMLINVRQAEECRIASHQVALTIFCYRRRAKRDGTPSLTGRAVWG